MVLSPYFRGMERYFRQLVEDMRHAKANVPEPWWTFVDQDEYLLPWAEDPKTAPRKSLEEWTGLKKVQLPPVNYLSKRQLHILLTELKDMLGEYNCHVVFQVSVPEDLQYEVIRKRFDQQSPLLLSNMHFFEFCDNPQNRGNCLLGEYCHCRFFESLLADYEEDGIDFETGHNVSFEEENDHLDAFEADVPFFEDFQDEGYDDFDELDYEEDDEDEDDWSLY